MNFTIEPFEGKTYLTCPLSETDNTDPLLMGMLQHNRIPGFAVFCMRTEDETQQLCYDIDGLRPMKDVFGEVVSRHVLLNTFDRILTALESAQDYMIEASSVLLDPQYIFIDPTSFRLALICLPFLDDPNGCDEKAFFKNVMFHSIFDYNEPCDHVARIMNYLNASEFDCAEFRSLLEELGASENTQAPVTEPEPFFDFTVSDTPSEKTALQEAEDLLSAALEEAPAAQKEEDSTDPFAFLDAFAAPEPAKEEEEDPFADWFAPKEEKKSEAAEISFDEFTTPIVSSRKKAASEKPAAQESAPAEPDVQEFDFFGVDKKPATEAMKLADDLLSAALAAEPIVQKETPNEETPAPEGPVEDAFSFDFDSFAAPAAKKSAARLEAEAILDSLDLFAPASEEAASAEPEESVLPSKPPVVQEETRQEPVRKGGFFSKLRKKEEAPAQKESTPSVIPYFGSDGETTVLNVAQQMTKPAAPYLLRSSNQETIVLSKPVFRMGKDKDFTDYCISDNSAISRRHANFMVRNGDVFIVDNNSTNHTYVNGAMIRSNTEIKLTHGDEIRLANEDFMLYCAGTLS